MLRNIYGSVTVAFSLPFKAARIEERKYILSATGSANNGTGNRLV
jgi:hypothetical protein